MTRGRSVAVAVGGVSALAMLLGGCAPEQETSEPRGDGALSLSATGDEVYRCMVDKGWDPELDWAGGIVVSSETMSKEQLPLFDEDAAECWAPIDARVDAMTDDEILAVYESELATRECLIGRGYRVDPPPSEQVYLDSFHAERWAAYDGADLGSVMTDDAKWRALNEACPQPAWSLGAK